MTAHAPFRADHVGSLLRPAPVRGKPKRSTRHTWRRPRPVAVMHAGLIVGYRLFSTWAWNIICAPDVFAWYFVFMILNLGQLLYILYQLRPIKLEPDLEQVYHQLFQPLNVTRLQVLKQITEILFLSSIIVGA